MGRISYSRKIDAFLHELVLEIINVLDPEYILLAGSFGKNSWIYSESELLSDFEIVFVCNKRWSISKKRKLLKELNEKYPYEINLKGFIKSKVGNKIISSYATSNPGYISLEFYDTFKDPVLLYSKNKKEYIKLEFDTTEIPIWEAWRLYSNRVADLLHLKNLNKTIVDDINYFSLKILESTADAYLIVNGIYSKNISDRIQLFTKERLQLDEQLSNVCKNSWNIINMALKSREIHSMEQFSSMNFVIDQEIIISWMTYFDAKMAFDLNMTSTNWNEFYLKLVDNIDFQRSFTELNYRNNIFFSNLLRLIYNRKLMNSKFKFFKIGISWQHWVLISVVCYFRESSNPVENDYAITRNLLSKLFDENFVSQLSNDDLRLCIIVYWKMLR